MLSIELLVRPIQTQYDLIAERQTQPIYPPQAPEQNIVKTCINYIYIVGNNRLEWTVCKDAYHHRCSIPPITNYYKTSNSWKCSRCKPIVGHGHATLLVPRNRQIFINYIKSICLTLKIDYIGDLMHLIRFIKKLNKKLNAFEKWSTSGIKSGVFLYLHYIKIQSEYFHYSAYFQYIVWRLNYVIINQCNFSI